MDVWIYCDLAVVVVEAVVVKVKFKFVAVMCGGYGVMVVNMVVVSVWGWW